MNTTGKRVVNAYVTSTISMTLLLFLLGVLFLVVINAGQLARYVREKIGFTLILHDNIKDIEVVQLQKQLSAARYIKSTRYIDKETAALDLQEQLGENFIGFLGFNPLFSSVEVKLMAAYTNPDSIAAIEKEFLSYPEVKEVFYQKNLVSLINKNVKRIGLILFVFSGLLLVIFTALMNNTIRFSIFSQRFIINTMQMVGAKRSFIRKPFIQRSVFWGVVGALLADLLLLMVYYVFRNELHEYISQTNLLINGLAFVFLIIFGILVSWLSSYFAVNKFLRLNFDELFY